ncbi:glycosyl hydrolase family 61 [Colletotrichum karsti]|uniref:lytic cellulose monooxygenase (C4-dehydrogenating) n=1 Tax=Colletotrichum karsti TaxID=1095194 RepID=A0A9P6HVU7_9PEZI|nr:glycosyl hydrolase family 61 [Colletotrichum karsti]KAF9871314.1 glycosyl hydrolase family 61 [Colletotrichum karsti]
MHIIAFIAILTLSSVASAHSRITNFVINGASYSGYNAKIPNNPKLLAAWKTTVSDDGWVSTESYGKPNLVCHRDASNPIGYVPVSAGETIDIQWQGWPESHHGPVLTYMAFCGSQRGSCESVDKTKLDFFAIDKVGLIDPSKNATDFATARGIWASDVLIQNNASWVVQIPSKIAAGYYVLRHEIIALHFARYPGQGAQHYPQCINIQVTGGGVDIPAGISGAKLYEAAEEGLVYDISQSPLPPYKIPGPTVYSGAKTFAAQTGAKVLSSATAIPGVPDGARADGTAVGLVETMETLAPVKDTGGLF